jgi:hypothetical protein
VRADIDHDLVAMKHALAAIKQRNLDRLRANEAAVAHDEFGAGLSVKTKVKVDLEFDHVLLAAPHLRHIDFYAIGDGTERRRVPNEMRHPGAPYLVLGGQACHGGAGATDPLPLHDGNLLAGLPQMPGKPLSALAAAEDDGVESFKLRHHYLLSADRQAIENVCACSDFVLHNYSWIALVWLHP